MNLLLFIGMFLLASPLSSSATMEEANEAPEIISKGGEIFARENSSLSLECITKNIGEYVLMWRFNRGNSSREVLLFADRFSIEQMGKPLFADAFSLGPETTNALNIKRLDRDLTGEYKCELSTNPSRWITYTVSMTNTTTESEFISKGGEITAQENSSLTLDCVTKNMGKYTFVWMFIGRDGQTKRLFLNRRDIVSKSTKEFGLGPETTNALIIKKLTSNQVGEYRCHINTRPMEMITYNISLAEPLEEANEPELISKGGEIIARENSTLTLDCATKNLGEYPFAWIFTHKQTNHSVVLFANRNQILRSSVISLGPETTNGLVIKRLNRDMVGEYRCQIHTNPIKWISYNISLMTEPVIIPDPPSGRITVSRNGPISLKCNIEPLSSPITVQWLFNGKVVESNSTQYEILYAQPYNDGSYVCVASNEVGQKQFTFNVTVEYEPQITLPKRIINAAIGSKVELRCEVKANPRAVISWHFSNNSLVHSSNHRIDLFEKYSILTILNVGLRDYDNYYCKADNSIGSQSAFFEVTGKSTELNFISAQVERDGNSYLLEWIIFSEYPIRSYHLRWREIKHNSIRVDEWKHTSIIPVNAGEGPVRKQSFRLENLDFSSQVNAYLFELEADNGFGRPRYASALLSQGSVCLTECLPFVILCHPYYDQL